MKETEPHIEETAEQRSSGAKLVASTGGAERVLTNEERRLISIFRAMSADAKCDAICMLEALARSFPAASVGLRIVSSK